MIKRKLQIGATLSKQSIQMGLGTHHAITREELEKTYMQYAQQTEDLRLIPEYKQLFNFM